MTTIGNFLWIITGGLLTAVIWWLVGIVAFITVIFIPWGKACFIIGNLAFLPFGRQAISRKELSKTNDIGTGLLGIIGNVLWFVFAGFWLALLHVGVAIALFLSIIGIPFGLQHLKLAGLALIPIGKTVVSNDVARAVRTANAAEMVARTRAQFSRSLSESPMATVETQIVPEDAQGSALATRAIDSSGKRNANWLILLLSLFVGGLVWFFYLLNFGGSSWTAASIVQRIRAVDASAQSQQPMQPAPRQAANQTINKPSPVLYSQTALVHQLCDQETDVLFSCKIAKSKKMMSVCRANGLAEYRFGTSENLEIKMPDGNETPSIEIFKESFATGEIKGILFQRGDYEYSVQNYFGGKPPSEHDAILVKSNANTIADLRCENSRFTKGNISGAVTYLQERGLKLVDR